MALETYRDGCAAETLSALTLLDRAERDWRDGSARLLGDLWFAIAVDELRHAMLAWRTIAWALSRTSRDQAASLRTELRRSVNDASLQPLADCILGHTGDEFASGIDVRAMLRNAARDDEFVTQSMLNRSSNNDAPIAQYATKLIAEVFCVGN